MGLTQYAVRQCEPESVDEPVPPRDGTYRAIVIDPPWPMRKIERREAARAQRQRRCASSVTGCYRGRPRIGIGQTCRLVATFIAQTYRATWTPPSAFVTHNLRKRAAGGRDRSEPERVFAGRAVFPGNQGTPLIRLEGPNDICRSGAHL